MAVISSFLFLKYEFLLTNNKYSKNINSSAFELSRYNANLVKSENLELQLSNALDEKNGISIFGSSELTNESEYISYNFFPNKIGVRASSFGHAYHQNFAIYCQLLAFKDKLKNAKVCIFLSPGWFETEGTNIEAFLEFVRPNFLKKIIKDQTINIESKISIGEFLLKNEDKIENPSPAINYFLEIVKFKNIPFLNNYSLNKYKLFENIKYQKSSNDSKNAISDTSKIDWDEELKINEEKFISNIKSNNIFVNDEYYTKFLKPKNGKLIKATFSSLAPKENQELKDFKLLVKLLKEQNCDASFVIQTLNPYYYDNLENFNPILKEIVCDLKEAKFPFLNVFTTSKQEYIPGTLNDVMHVGDVGWININHFLYKTYVQK